MPKMLALMAVQRQTAASRSRRPWMTLQQGFTGGVPTVTLSNEPSKSAHTPNLSASFGHFPPEGFGVGVGTVGVGLGLGGGGQLLLLAVTREKKRRLTARKRASDVVLLEAIEESSSSSEL
ncbi:hypothetical protein NC653_001754 [Populus alba x Populus x berolinensis]|uniref:Uncharacterized protein n=1 Tax=Populus alba x Populus x berolinensis TaxID=444605 RepID=A0AAD6RLZ8_9ROSI|nr:hypothetical protein NC653_001754 [Populus alba x Populus x berolinensis]